VTVRCPECRVPLSGTLEMCGEPSCSRYGLRPSCLEMSADPAADQAYAGRMRRAMQRRRPEPDGDPLLAGARAGNAHLALLWLEERGMGGVGHEPGWPDDEG
jgi:hypothetical protein